LKHFKAQHSAEGHSFLKTIYDQNILLARKEENTYELKQKSRLYKHYNRWDTG